MDNALQTIFAVGGVILFIVFAILIALYVIESLALLHPGEEQRTSG